jgi:hypothetical protein
VLLRFVVLDLIDLTGCASQLLDQVMEGTGHFGPMEQPQTLARIIAASCEIVAPEIAVKSKL